MPTIYVLTEERSAERIVRSLADRYAPAADVVVVPHSGKSDLCASFPRKITAIRYPADARFIVLHDNDSANCRTLKARLTQLLPANASNRVKIRIVMQELESWYLGQPEALSGAGLITQASCDKIKKRAKFRNPDSLGNAKQEFYRLHARENQPIALAELIAPHLKPEDNRSPSFQLFVRTLREFGA
ncbi:MAG: DUF4276 family protein [Methylocystis sp.]|nr:DUF4276 family protein [Methylocystis sp.]MCA3582814.1 DUF4276 family protein [Methylocystis sp.]MCA3586503.1 DUF4276 family protein [Methylocystis sp.]MCA3592111.1 DUF4276 family protein [Methylocystis sp.]